MIHILKKNFFKLHFFNGLDAPQFIHFFMLDICAFLLFFHFTNITEMNVCVRERTRTTSIKTMVESESHSVVSDSLLSHALYIPSILQARILEWVAFPFSRGSSQPRNWTRSLALWADSLPAELQGKPNNSAVGSLSLLQRIFYTQESNRGLLHCRRFFTNWAIREVGTNQTIFTTIHCVQISLFP